MDISLFLCKADILKLFLVIQLSYIAYVDFRHRYIEDLAVLIVMLTSLILHIGQNSFSQWLSGGLLAFVINSALYCLFYSVYKDEVFGQGDVLLMTALGSLLGPEMYIAYYIFETLIAGLLAACYMLMRSKKNGAIPMAPVYIFTLLIFYFLGEPNIYELMLKYI